MKKYYWVHTMYSAYGSEWKPQNFACDIHPLTKVHEFNQMEGYETSLCGWQEITEEEYNLSKSYG